MTAPHPHKLAMSTPPRRRTTRVITPRDYDDFDDRPTKPRKRPRRSMVWQWVLMVIIGSVLGVALWAFTVHVTVTLVPPLGETRTIPLNEVEFDVLPVGEASTTQIEAARLETTITVSEVSEALTEVPMPEGRARGTIQVINTLDQPINLPAGTEFIARGASNEVRLMLDNPTTVPAAVTESSLTGSTTRYGQVEVSVTARSAGSASNVGENRVTTLLLPGQGALVTDQGQIILRNGLIGGGSETMRRIVSEGDMARLLGAALAKSYVQGLKDLQAQAQQRMLMIDDATILPASTMLGSPVIYGEPRLEPAVGTVLDPRNAEVRLTVQMTFSAFAVKADNTVQNQLQRVVPLRFQSGRSPVCKVGELPKFRISDWQATKSSVLINGEVQCAPQMPVDETVVAALPRNLQGLQANQAQQLLEQLKSSGVISDYQLPARAEMPPLAQLITIRVGGSIP
ncbi:MAG: hypothetical protein ACO3F2_05565 [Roseiflexaceae bacterium]